MRIIFATRNRGKLAELRRMLADNVELDLVALDEVAPALPPIAETGSTFAENARIKAEVVSQATGLPALADDSGLEVDALGGRPGVHSARYGGPDASDRDRVDKLLAELREVAPADRTARFRCAIAFANPDAAEATVIREATCEGCITSEPRGGDGFGYDPIFYVSELEQTFAEAAPAEKNRLSHRGRAMRQIAAWLRETIGRDR